MRGYRDIYLELPTLVIGNISIGFIPCLVIPVSKMDENCSVSVNLLIVHVHATRIPRYTYVRKDL